MTGKRETGEDSSGEGRGEGKVAFTEGEVVPFFIDQALPETVSHIFYLQN